MDLPELRHHLAEFLGRRELAAAARVCKSWQESFTPLLYRRIIWSAHKGPSSQSIVANAEHIRSVEIDTEPLDFPLEAFTKLESVSLCFYIDSRKTWRRLAILLRQNPELETLSTSISGQEEHMSGFMKALASSCPKLQTLEAHFESLDNECTQLLLDVSVRVRDLSINNVNLAPPDTMDRWPAFPNLEKLEMILSWSLTLGQQLEVIRRSPRLKALVWDLCGSERNLSSLPNIISTYCPHLEALEMIDGRDVSVDVSSVLDSCQRLSTLTLAGFEFDARALVSLSRHFSHLAHLDIEDCHFTSSTILLVLTSCPLLESLSADTLDACDILGITENQEGHQTFQPQDWVCTNLHSFTVFICGLEGKPNEWQIEVLKQLSRLTRLSTLRIGCWGVGGTELCDGLDLRLRSGLGILSGLYLRELAFCGLWQEMEDEDVRWMVEAWPELSYVTGRLNHNLARETELQGILEGNGVFHPMPRSRAGNVGIREPV
ncbi:hypothetical protein B0O80DRAFT_500925 [Mortierella sp. GBAus27b]|nr:hypothetical protein B0O80DRAFT_500925 [Mortierella sp. GBAus27b]